MAQALLQAHKVPVVRWRELRCVLPYALEGWLRRELAAHGASLIDAQHGDGVTVSLRVPAASADSLVARLNDAGQGRVLWLKDGDGPSGRDEA
ncbi:hypothetical protein D9M68_956150 [compost metagenome]